MMPTPTATAGPTPQAQPEGAKAKRKVKLKLLVLPSVAAIFVIAMVVEIVTTEARSNPPISQMGWAILAAITVSLCARYIYKLQRKLVGGSKLEPKREKEILHNQRILLGLVGVALLAVGVFLGSVY